MVRRTKEEAQETRRQILEAAEQAFYDRGVARTTLADIATLAGVTRGAIYWHFSNKADLVQAMLDSLHEPLEEMARASESAEETDPLGWTRKLLVRLFQQVATDPKTRRINEILAQWLLVPESFQLFLDAERLVDTVLDMLRYSCALRDPACESASGATNG